MKKLICILIVCFLFGCTNSETMESSFENLTYYNSTLGFSMQFLEGYTKYSDEQMADALGISVEQLQSQSIDDIIYEFIIAEDTNVPIFQFYIEKYTFTTSATYEDFVLQVAKQFYAQEDSGYAVGTIEEIEINGISLKKIPLRILVGNYEMFQDIYMLKKAGFVGTLMVSYIENNQEEVEEIIQSIQLYE